MIRYLSQAWKRPRTHLCMLIAALAVWPIATGCDIQFDVPSDIGNPDDDTTEPESPVPASGLLLTLINRTDAAVDAEIYVSTNSLDATADDLFVSANAFTEGIGLAGRGILQPLATDEVELTCSEGLVLGSAGGTFLDPESGDVLGTGPARILQEGLVFDCGSEIALVFRVDDDDEYTVTVALE